MKWTSIFALCAIAFFGGACEKHPLAGQPPVREHHAEGEAHPEGEKKEAAAEPAKPAETEKTGEKPAEKTGESPKFFPDKK